MQVLLVTILQGVLRRRGGKRRHWKSWRRLAREILNRRGVHVEVQQLGKGERMTSRVLCQHQEQPVVEVMVVGPTLTW